MQLTVVGTGSKGNCYLLHNANETLIIECGVIMREIKKALNFSVANVAGCIVTHEHKDHSKAIEDMLQVGINTYTSRGTMRALALDVSHHRLHTIKEGEIFHVGNFKVWPFAIQHDCNEPLGFIINHSETGNVLFITDTMYVKNTFKNIHNIIIEANYSKEIIDRKLGALSEMEFLKNRVLKSHMSIDQCIATLRANNLKQVNNIVLIHLSDSNSDATGFGKAVRAATGKQVHVADNGLMIDFNKRSF